MNPIYLKKDYPYNCYAKFTTEGMIDVFSTDVNTKLFDDQEDCDCNFRNYIKDGFVRCEQQEFDEALIKAVSVINKLSNL